MCPAWENLYTNTHTHTHIHTHTRTHTRTPSLSLFLPLSLSLYLSLQTELSTRQIFRNTPGNLLCGRCLAAGIRVAKTHKIPYVYKSLSAKESYD